MVGILQIDGGRGGLIKEELGSITASVINIKLPSKIKSSFQNTNNLSKIIINAQNIFHMLFCMLCHNTKF